MGDLRARIFRAALEGMHVTRLHRVLEPFVAGRGVVFTMHHVRPAPTADFSPNALLEVTPEFLGRSIRAMRAAGFDIVTLDEALRRLSTGDGRRFCALTFDDGYRDVRDHALPVLRAHQAPATIFVTTAFADQTGDLWWLTLEDVIRRLDHLRAEIGGERIDMPARTTAEKRRAWHRLYWRLRTLDEVEMRGTIYALADMAGVDSLGHAARLCLDWDELREVAAEPLIEIGAHTLNHYMLAKWPEATVRAELAHSRERIGRELGVDARHLAFPVGDPTSAGAREFAIARDLGFASAWTTRPGHVFAGHRDHMTALPRVSLNGYYQEERYLSLFLSGLPFALWNRFRRISVA